MTKYFWLVFLGVLLALGCQDKTPIKNEKDSRGYPIDEFVMGADLSYVNQIMDHDGTYRDSGMIKNPYKIFSDYGTNVVRLRLWHNPD